MTQFTFSLISDMHVDFPQQKTPYDLISKNVIVAGDTSNGLGGLKFLNKLKNKGFEVFAVDGNHEHYSNANQGRTIDTTEVQFFAGLEQAQVRHVEFERLAIVGVNGWYPVTNEALWSNYMNDCRNCATNAMEVNAIAADQAAWLRGTLEALVGKAIVVTHTAPCSDTLNPQYDGHFSNEWYWNPLMRQVLREYADKILVWCHGHTHRAADKVVDGVRVIANPRGYPRENPDWKPLTVTVEY